MAKSSSNKTGGASRIRFVMVEAEIADGELGPITQAIQNALRGAAPPVQRISAPTNGAKVIAPEIEEESEFEEEAEAEVAISPKPRTQRKPAATPDVLEVDLITDPSFASYAEKASPKSNQKRYLVVAAWFKEHRGVDAITASHVYTCYRAVKWPSNIEDFVQPLRDLKARKFFSQPDKGSYAINHLGLAEVEAMISGGK